MTTMTAPMALTIIQLANQYQLNPRTVSTNVTRAPHLLPKVTRFGRSIRFLTKDIDQWVKQNQH